eukprot:TRINITY_DN1399_c0_g2_i1.p1 TRINITY_DN1399_c0_g2~~TRINITY_DN1399_c0_g2_i1.p1  ORF type:complete len:731 (-),score=72.81 TRINITY_DN1399_c0_g2_i1:151-2043(-)
MCVAFACKDGSSVIYTRTDCMYSCFNYAWVMDPTLITNATSAGSASSAASAAWSSGQCYVQSAITSLSAATTTGSTSLSVVDSSMFAAGYSIRVQAEITTITEVSSGRIVVATPLQGTYRAGTAILLVASDRSINIALKEHASSCPANAVGANVGAGCSCNAGYAGTISSTEAAPYYQGSCSAVGCPVNSNGLHVPNGCSCNAGYSGIVTASTVNPFYTSTCSTVHCPANSAGNHVPAGCSCNAGFAGSVSASTQSPFYVTSCSGVACPANSNGADVPSGCSCNAGYAGAVSAITTSPFYISSCSAVVCPANSNGVQVPSGCSCNAGYAGSVSAVTSSPFYTSSCSAVVCPANSNGNHVPSGCSCNAGYAGSVSAITSSPFYASLCSAVVCPANSNGNGVPSGCSCNTGYHGRIVGSTTGPGYSGSCAQNVCSCSNGRVATGTTCTSNGATICASCDSGYSLSGSACAASVSYSFLFGGQSHSSYSGAILDMGYGYGDYKTTEGYSYGWLCNGSPMDSTQESSQRGGIRSPPRSTYGLNHFDRSNKCKSGSTYLPVTWKVGVPAGTYQVSVLFPESYKSKCSVMGTNAGCGTSSCTYTSTVTVGNDGFYIGGYGHDSGKCHSVGLVTISR